jgi:hypothetical protein
MPRDVVVWQREHHACLISVPNDEFAASFESLDSQLSISHHIFDDLDSVFGLVQGSSTDDFQSMNTVNTILKLEGEAIYCI